jgi:hypothetical protein
MFIDAIAVSPDYLMAKNAIVDKMAVALDRFLEKTVNRRWRMLPPFTASLGHNTKIKRAYARTAQNDGCSYASQGSAFADRSG